MCKKTDTDGGDRNNEMVKRRCATTSRRAASPGILPACNVRRHRECCFSIRKPRI